MKTEIKQYKKAVAKVTELESEINVTATENEAYYKLYGGEAEKQKDLADLRSELREAIDTELAALDSLRIAINIRRVDLNEQLRFITLQKVS
jgi:hypothetical protein